MLITKKLATIRAFATIKMVDKVPKMQYQLKAGHRSAQMRPDLRFAEGYPTVVVNSMLKNAVRAIARI